MTKELSLQIGRLIQYGLQKQLISKWDVEYCVNRLLDIFQMDEYEEVEVPKEALDSPVSILSRLLDIAYERGIISENTVTYRDLLDTKIMGCLTPRPSEVVRTFKRLYDENKEEATRYFYELSKDVHYIRTDRIAKNEHWFSETDYGRLEVTINLSKPEKDPKAIAAAKKLKSSAYPKCLLCKENVGYNGRLNHPARQNLRVVPIELDGEGWRMQYSPYVYYNEHAIVLCDEHRPMVINEGTFRRLLQFVDQFPHYFIGSNADLPIVGGSILSHDHYQGGNHTFPMANAPIEESFSLREDVQLGIVRWPMSVLRLTSTSYEKLVENATEILSLWRAYSDETVGVFASTNGEPHNTITPIARKNGDQFELDLVLRNNRTSKEHPLGIFHPHTEVHHIKKENIGLIEVMGLAVLPGRLKEEMELIAHYLVDGDLKRLKENEKTAKHFEWAEAILNRYENITKDTVGNILRHEVGKVFSTVLEHAGVFKRTSEGKEAFRRFIHHIQTNVQVEKAR
ncbi:UDP-glucose--hexose-1-phosphate uridylyltransferase [Bacillus kexueae]|uniref:UDP-glucose--hexose-1-phosphate uridylyltransferase n=1 Tax=Aeribacillus kexueae TaxID=2078952 RepID=UPI001FAEFDF8